MPTLQSHAYPAVVRIRWGRRSHAVVAAAEWQVPQPAQARGPPICLAAAHGVAPRSTPIVPSGPRPVWWNPLWAIQLPHRATCGSLRSFLSAPRQVGGQQMPLRQVWECELRFAWLRRSWAQRALPGPTSQRKTGGEPSQQPPLPFQVHSFFFS